jgi:hypothetical protein
LLHDDALRAKERRSHLSMMYAGVRVGTDRSQRRGLRR